MANEQKALASQVVKTFQALLETDVKNEIGESNFDALDSLICEAIGAHAESIIERLEDVLKQINAELEKRPIEL